MLTRPLVLASGLRFPEGPAFAPDGTLWCVELLGGALVELRDGVPVRHAVGGEPNGLAFGPDGLVWFCDAKAGAIRRYDPGTGTCATISERVYDRPNDLAFDGAGRLVFTCPGNSRTDPTGTVWSLDRNGVSRLLADQLYFPNGLAFSADGTELVVAETYQQRLWRGDYSAATGDWLSPRPVVHLPGPIGPDGMAFEKSGALSVAVFGQGIVARVDTEGHMTPLVVPGAKPTNCCFDPSGALGLVVSEAQFGQLLAFPDLGPGISLLEGW